MNRRDVLIGSAALLASTPAQAKAQSQAQAQVGTPPRGLWRDDVGEVGIGAFPEFGVGMFAFDYAGERVGPLHSAGARTWEMSGALDGNAPALETLSLDGETLRLGARRLAPVAIDRQAFTVRTAGTTMAAEVARVAGARSRGAVLMIYGSGPAPKAAFDPWALWFLGEGFAVITTDKRGSGESTGDWRLTSLEDLAHDAAAVLGEARLQGLAGPVFAWGASQGGWIEPQLGAAGLLDGIIMHAGAATTPGAQILAQIEYELRAYGFASDEIARAKAYYALDTQVSQGLAPWSRIEAAYEAATQSRAEWILAPPAPDGSPERTMIKLMADFDPAPYWRANTAPTLALYGGKDWIVPAETNLPRLREIASTRTALSAIVIPAANHLMFEARSGTRDEYPRLSRLAPAYFQTIRAWLAKAT